MRVIAVVVIVAGSCRFDPTGGTGPPGDDTASDAAVVDAAAIDASVIDARVIDARAIDARAIDARLPCPTSYDVSSNGGRYSFRPIAMQHQLAEGDCADDLPGRTHLATFELGVTMTAVIEDVNPGAQATPWVGATCVGDCRLTLAWLWSSNVPVSPLLWAPQQPHGGGDKVARVERQPTTLADWRLVNVSPSSTLPYICECDP